MGDSETKGSKVLTVMMRRVREECGGASSPSIVALLSLV